MLFLRRFVASSALVLATTNAASNMVPNYEVKLLMQPTAVLGSDFKLLPTVLSSFSISSSSVTKLNVQYLDTNNKDIYNNQWSPRIRKVEGKSGFEENYKIRYPITNGDINAALTQANNDGFDSSSSYDAQVEWGYQQKTLSISKDKSANPSGYSGMDLPGENASRNLLINDSPDKFNDWLYNNWGRDQLSNSRIFGPILAKRSIGTFNNLQLYIEVWPIKAASGSGTEYVVEASFKVNDQSSASTQKDNLQNFLQSKGWFLAQDSLKTSIIMQRY